MSVQTIAEPSTNSRSRLDIDAIRSAASGRWRSTIFPSLGIDVGNGEHRPCPYCGGTDRFFCDDREGRGEWFCRQCDPQAGDGFHLVMKVRGCDFLQACRLVAEVLGLGHGCTINTRNIQPVRIPHKHDLSRTAFRLEMAAVDRRLRAETVFLAVSNFNSDELTDREKDRLLSAVARAFDDINHAALLEQLADDCRLRAFHEKEVRHAAA